MDDADLATQCDLLADELIHRRRYDIPKGVAGICKDCDEQSPRLIDGCCARCRDINDRRR